MRVSCRYAYNCVRVLTHVSLATVPPEKKRNRRKAAKSDAQETPISIKADPDASTDSKRPRARKKKQPPAVSAPPPAIKSEPPTGSVPPPTRKKQTHTPKTKIKPDPDALPAQPSKPKRARKPKPKPKRVPTPPPLPPSRSPSPPLIELLPPPAPPSRTSSFHARKPMPLYFGPRHPPRTLSRENVRVVDGGVEAGGITWDPAGWECMELSALPWLAGARFRSFLGARHVQG